MTSGTMKATTTSTSSGDPHNGAPNNSSLFIEVIQDLIPVIGKFFPFENPFYSFTGVWQWTVAIGLFGVQLFVSIQLYYGSKWLWRTVLKPMFNWRVSSPLASRIAPVLTSPPDSNFASPASVGNPSFVLTPPPQQRPGPGAPAPARVPTTPYPSLSPRRRGSPRAPPSVRRSRTISSPDQVPASVSNAQIFQVLTQITSFLKSPARPVNKAELQDDLGRIYELYQEHLQESLRPLINYFVTLTDAVQALRQELLSTRREQTNIIQGQEDLRHDLSERLDYLIQQSQQVSPPRGVQPILKDAGNSPWEARMSSVDVAPVVAGNLFSGCSQQNVSKTNLCDLSDPLECANDRQVVFKAKTSPQKHRTRNVVLSPPCSPVASRSPSNHSCCSLRSASQVNIQQTVDDRLVSVLSALTDKLNVAPQPSQPRAFQPIYTHLPIPKFQTDLQSADAYMEELDSYMNKKRFSDEDRLGHLSEIFAHNKPLSLWWTRTRRLCHTWADFRLAFLAFHTSTFNANQAKAKLFSKLQQDTEDFQTFAFKTHLEYMNIDPTVDEKVVMDLICQRAQLPLRSALLSALPSLPDFDALIALGSSLERALPQPVPRKSENKDNEDKVGNKHNASKQNNNGRGRQFQKQPQSSPPAASATATGQQQQQSASNRILKCTRCQADGHTSNRCTAPAPVAKANNDSQQNKTTGRKQPAVASSPEKVSSLSTPSGNDKQ